MHLLVENAAFQPAPSQDLLPPITGRGTRNRGLLRPGEFCLVPEGSGWAGLGLNSGLEPLGWTAELLGAAGSGHPWLMLARR